MRPVKEEVIPTSTIAVRTKETREEEDLRDRPLHYVLTKGNGVVTIHRKLTDVLVGEPSEIEQVVRKDGLDSTEGPSVSGVVRRVIGNPRAAYCYRTGIADHSTGEENAVLIVTQTPQVRLVEHGHSSVERVSEVGTSTTVSTTRPVNQRRERAELGDLTTSSEVDY